MPAHGSRFRRNRRRAEARTPLRQVWEIFDRLGATPYTAQAAVELEATGERIGDVPEPEDRRIPLRHVYTKLDVHSRKDLAEILQREEPS